MSRATIIAWSFFFALILAALIFLNVLKMKDASKDTRQLHAPALRLVGHWQLYSRSDLPSYEFFFSPTSGEPRRGELAMLDNFEDFFLLRGTYQILDESVSGTRLLIQQDLGNQAVREVALLLSKDGRSAQYTYVSGDEKFMQHMKYVDDLTHPPAVEELNRDVYGN
ncbi:MAG: hypothetical protein ACI9QL_000162 [Candidatus Omnitrophota bacterium]|jgi:hypothetical protein